ncbi:hypothetical protein ACFLZH_04185 [Patescibacteria group bacterium]
MKKFLALITLSIAIFVFIGCTGETAQPTIEPTATTTDATTDEPEVTEEPKTEDVEVITNEERRKALDEKVAKEIEADIQVGKDHQVLQAIRVERDLTAEDCELIKDPTYKADCLIAFGT